MRWKFDACNPCVQLFAGDEAYTRRNSSSTRSSSSSSSRPRIAARTDRSTASAVLAVGGGTAGQLAEAGSCLANSFPGAEAEAIVSELLRQPRGRATRARQSAEACLLFVVFARTLQNTAQKYKIQKTQNTMVRHSRKSTRDQGPTNISKYQR